MCGRTQAAISPMTACCLHSLAIAGSAPALGVPRPGPAKGARQTETPRPGLFMVGKSPSRGIQPGRRGNEGSRVMAVPAGLDGHCPGWQRGDEAGAERFALGVVITGGQPIPIWEAVAALPVHLVDEVEVSGL